MCEVADGPAHELRDADGDGRGDENPISMNANAGTDCDDSDAANYPTNTEICDLQDNNCDNLIDEADPTLASCP